MVIAVKEIFSEALVRWLIQNSHSKRFLLWPAFITRNCTSVRTESRQHSLSRPMINKKKASVIGPVALYCILGAKHAPRTISYCVCMAVEYVHQTTVQ